ncbi:MAG: hypothetical protein HQK87_05045 [Nitrospinae bacterium]|nr:hypothetical protein [Nitrospinota bacterium]
MLLRIARRIDPLLSQLAHPTMVEELTPQSLVEAGAEGVILDHDGILSAMGAEGPDDTGRALLEALVARFGHGKIYILSNSVSARSARFDFYRGQWPGVGYIMAARKPSAAGLRQVESLSGLPASKIAVVDDGVLTGILMAVENGAIPVYALRRELRESATERFFRRLTTGVQLALVRLVAAMTGARAK